MLSKEKHLRNFCFEVKAMRKNSDHQLIEEELNIEITALRLLVTMANITSDLKLLSAIKPLLL